MPGGRLQETENKRICRVSGLKSGRGHLRNSRVVAYERVFKTLHLSDWEAKRSFPKWSLTGGGRLREVVAMRVLTVFGIPINEQK